MSIYVYMALIEELGVLGYDTKSITLKDLKTNIESYRRMERLNNS